LGSRDREKNVLRVKMIRYPRLQTTPRSAFKDSKSLADRIRGKRDEAEETLL